ncbi:BMA_0021/BMA_0022 family TOMM bacteriocin [Polyangium sorediatum]|uniref:BMA_0021/BMA_0022 family TOMM bacteriocin n=1 Tax=Polyangium sorediatum TaxID=889274 RepID=A0ABT6NY36_9BACT|nr:BMA_0021/BMA_0022 family TOMM bacteriocin [Polyangium sorediatum]MDI1433260.1 BMA_0021/BMA_0022 family TOMM bacteriocin [Polyangium sorediatum]
MNKLLDFRTAYMRSIATAWSSPSFLNELTTNPTGTLSRYFGFDWPWTSACTLEITTSEAAQGRFEWIGDEWVWSKNLLDSLTLYLPLTAPSSDPNARAMALADYYRQRASLFSDDWGTEYGPLGPLSALRSPRGVPVLNDPAIGPHSSAPVGGFVPSDNEFSAFQVALLSALAKAWADPGFKQKLLIDSTVALHTIRGYELPWNMNIIIRDDSGAHWTPPNVSSSPPSHGQSYWTFSQPSALTLYLPTKPHNVEAEPIALAAYNATGAEYPFTCCC